MKKTIKIEDDFSELIPNPDGIPCRNKDSEKLRKEHDRWKEEIYEKRCKEFSQLHYWETASICSAL
ncbi:MAG: hypothetical protein ACI85Q_002454 [Salibacteraceae bacterium]|jgi:hypothetical protein